MSNSKLVSILFIKEKGKNPLNSTSKALANFLKEIGSNNSESIKSIEYLFLTFSLFEAQDKFIILPFFNHRG